MRRIAFCILVALAAACGKSTPTTPVIGVERIVPTFARTQTGLASALRLVIRDADTFAAVWNDAYGQLSPVPPLPEVDFRREMVLLAAMGEQSSSGYVIEVVGVQVHAERTVVYVQSLRPGPNCVVATVMTTPIDMVKAPIVTGLIQFEDRIGRSDCR